MNSNFNDTHSRLKSIIVEGVDYLSDHSEGSMKIALASIANQLDEIALEMWNAHDSYVSGAADNQSSMGDTIARLDEDTNILRSTIDRLRDENNTLKTELARLKVVGCKSDDVRGTILNKMAYFKSVKQPTDVQLDNIIFFLNRGDWISAIKEFRTVTGTGLKESKDSIEEVMAIHGFSKR